MIYVIKVGLDLGGKTCQEQYFLVDQAIFLVNPKSYYQKMKQALFRLAFIYRMIIKSNLMLLEINFNIFNYVFKIVKLNLLAQQKKRLCILISDTYDQTTNMYRKFTFVSIFKLEFIIRQESNRMILIRCIESILKVSFKL